MILTDACDERRASKASMKYDGLHTVCVKFDSPALYQNVSKEVEIRCSVGKVPVKTIFTEIKLGKSIG